MEVLTLWDVIALWLPMFIFIQWIGYLTNIPPKIFIKIIHTNTINTNQVSLNAILNIA